LLTKLGLPRPEQLTDKDGLETSRIRSDIKLTLQWCEAAVAMTVQVHRPAVHAVPGAEWIMAKYEHNAFDFQLRVRLHTTPFEPANAFSIVVSRDQVLSSLQSRED
jgi:hypothetical protein